MSSFTDFISAHENDDTARLLLSRDKYPGIDIPLAASTIECRRKLRSKVPSFYAEPSLIYPDRLCAEQCSSEYTALRKAEIAYMSFVPQNDEEEARNDVKSGQASATREHLPGIGWPERSEGHLRPRALAYRDVQSRGEIRIADLTGGLGVDSAAFSKIAAKVLYNEAKPELAAAARHNFAALGIDNIEVHSKIIMSGNAKPEASDTATPAELLADFRPDLIFLDPARRAEDGRKVFLIEDCQPDILSLKDELLAISRFVMVKLSPMADIDMVIRRLGCHCRLVEVVSVQGECKELIALLDRDFNGECTITANCSGALLSFRRSDEDSGQASGSACRAEKTVATLGSLEDCNEIVSIPNFTKDADARLARRGNRSILGVCKDFRDRSVTQQMRFCGIWILEPDKALMKTAPFKLLERHFAVTQLARDTHYYITDSHDLERFQGYFKIFEILKAEPLNKRTLKAMAEEFPEAEVTARNIPMSSDELRKRLNVRPSDQYHIFGLKYRSQNSLFACRKCSPW